MALVNGYESVNNDFDTLFEDGDESFDQDAASPFPQDVSMTEVGGADDELGDLLKEGGGDAGFDINKLNDEDLDIDQKGKADDAEDYGDISDDDDLPDEEAAADNTLPELRSDGPSLLQGIEESAFDDDDLFGGPSSPTETFHALPATSPKSRAGGDDDSVASEGDATSGLDALQPELDEIDDPQWLIQKALFEQSGGGHAPLTEQENIEEWLKLEYPQFNRDETPFFSRLFPPKPFKWTGKTPLRPPKPIHPTKVNLELDQDQKATFNSVAAAPSTWTSENAIVKVDLPLQAAVSEDSTDESDSEEELPGGIAMQDLDYLCADYDTLSAIAGSESELEDLAQRLRNDDTSMFDINDFPESDRPTKKRRTGLNAHDVVSIYRYDMPSFDNSDRTLKKLAQKVVLDLNDPALLLEEVDVEAARLRRPGEAVSGAKSVKDTLKGRFSTSNDAEYDLLKQNHQHKVRGQLGHLTIDHSLPALRLQWPYYQVRLPINEARQFHRKRVEFKQYLFGFNKITKLKRKHMKGKSTKEVYASSNDLGMGDNASALLLEYSEEHPTMLSQIGMGNKVVNYYRRKAKDDTSRPKGEIGETSVLLPEDKSPFHVFGHVDPGETVSAIYNSMYRAPIYEQDHKPHDFLVTRESTGQHLPKFHIRNIEHMYVVGQELPSVTVPGPHSRFVTTAAKNRLRTISYRLARRKKSHRIRVEEVTKHFPDTTDMQNRQKMKEFMIFSKEYKEWEMAQGAQIPDEDQIQTLIRPEDVCLLESMQVGQQYLQDAGFADEEDDDDDNEGIQKKDLSIEQELAPWKATKNFIHATQGKAMLKLHGDGDPSGRGEAFSFLKTSMKGGFKAQGASVNEQLSAAERKALGGHSYNVATQQKAYEDSIRTVWDKQKRSLELREEHEDDGTEEGVDAQDDSFMSGAARGTPRSSTATPAPFRRRDDETGTSFSKRSTTSQGGRFLRIRRRNRRGEVEEVVETNPAVIKQYLRLKHAKEAAKISLEDYKPTGDPEKDALAREFMETELARLEKNKQRRHQREKGRKRRGPASPSADAGSPDADGEAPAGGKDKATTRKCANCGQVGHIKTNKKLCPLLNGTIKQDDGFNTAAFMGAPPTIH